MSEKTKIVIKYPKRYSNVGALPNFTARDFIWIEEYAINDFINYKKLLLCFAIKRPTAGVSCKSGMADKSIRRRIHQFIAATPKMWAKSALVQCAQY